MLLGEITDDGSTIGRIYWIIFILMLIHILIFNKLLKILKYTLTYTYILHNNNIIKHF